MTESLNFRVGVWFWAMRLVQNVPNLVAAFVIKVNVRIQFIQPLDVNFHTGSEMLTGMPELSLFTGYVARLGGSGWGEMEAYQVKRIVSVGQQTSRYKLGSSVRYSQFWDPSWRRVKSQWSLLYHSFYSRSLGSKHAHSQWGWLIRIR